jgi:hypothetical protein
MPDTHVPTALQESLVRAYPGLAQVLRGSHGVELQRELALLLARAYPERSLRKVVRVIAKMVRRVAGLDVEESVLVHDISETGLSATIANHSNVSLNDVIAPQFVVKVVSSGREETTQREVRLSARLVRIVAAIDTGVVIAFRFENVTNDERQALYDVVQWVNPKERDNLAGNGVDSLAPRRSNEST